MTVDYLPFATSGGALVTDQPTYESAAYVAVGFQNGIADPAAVNKALRQASMVAAAVANYISVRLAQDVDDDGNLAALITAFANAVAPTAGDIAAGLGYTPVDKAGDTMGGPLKLAADPVNTNDAATKHYVDSVSVGLQPKAAVAAATTGANITLSGTQTIDGVALVAGQRVLVKDQTTASQNGIYVVASGAWTRATDIDGWSEVVGAFCFVSGGSVNLNSSWIAQVTAGGTINTTAMPWVAFSSLPVATSSAPGIVQLATNAEALAGTNTIKAVTPNDLAYVLTNSVFTAVRTRLAANADFYVNASTGNDSNNGASGTPWLTLQHAYSVLQKNYDFNGFTVTVHMTGAFTSTLVANGPITGQTGVGSLVFDGTGGASVASSGASVACFSGVSGAQFTVQNMTLTNSVAGTYCIRAVTCSNISVGPGMVFGSSSGVHIEAIECGVVYINNSYTITGGATNHWNATSNGVIEISPTGTSVVVTCTGTPAWSGAFALADRGGLIRAPEAISALSFSGAATGARYSVILNGIIDTRGASSTFFPGSIAGSTATGGQYA